MSAERIQDEDWDVVDGKSDEVVDDATFAEQETQLHESFEREEGKL